MKKYIDMTYEELLKAKKNLNKQREEINHECRLIDQAINQKKIARFTDLFGQYVKCANGNEDDYYLMKITDVNENEIKGVGVWCFKGEFPLYGFDHEICIEEWEWNDCTFTQLDEEEYKSLVENILNKCREMVM